MSIPDPGGSLSGGPSAGPVLSEPSALVAQGNPTGPAPSVGPLQAYVDAVPQTDAEKTSLLSAIATLGSAGKQAFVEQQGQTTAQRQAAMGSILSSTGQSGPAGPVTQALQAATQYQNNSAANQQQALGAYQNQIAQGANTLYNQTEAAVPVMQARTEQQVNSYYAQQRAQAQNDAEANAKAQQQLDIAIANAQAANSRAGTAATQQGTAQIQQGTAQINQNIADTKLGSTLATNGITVNGTGATTINNASKLVGTVMPQYPGFGDGQQGELAFYGLLAGDPAASKAPSYANVMSQINSLYSSNSPLVAGVNRQWLEMFVNAYFGRGSLPVPQQQTGILSAASQKILGSSPDLASAAASARTDTGNIG